jgi:hypothetical protein
VPTFIDAQVDDGEGQEPEDAGRGPRHEGLEAALRPVHPGHGVQEATIARLHNRKGNNSQGGHTSMRHTREGSLHVGASPTEVFGSDSDRTSGKCQQPPSPSMQHPVISHVTTARK